MTEQQKFGLFTENEVDELCGSFDIQQEMKNDLPIAAAAAGPEGAGLAAAAPEAMAAGGSAAV